MVSAVWSVVVMGRRDDERVEKGLRYVSIVTLDVEVRCGHRADEIA
jgi:hypothetical protein